MFLESLPVGGKRSHMNNKLKLNSWFPVNFLGKNDETKLQTEDYLYQVSEILSNPTVNDSNVENNYLNLTTNKEIKVQHFKIKLFKLFSILFFLQCVLKLLRLFHPKNVQI